MENYPKVLIAIGLYKAAHYLPDLIGSLDKITYPRDKYKIYIVDDVSPDNTFAELERLVNQAERKENFEIKVAEKNGGFCVNYNRGMRKAVEDGYDYVYILNQDTEVPAGFLEPLVEAMEADKSIALAQSKILYHNDKTKINSWGNEFHFLGFAYAGGNLETDNMTDEIKDVTYPSGAGEMMRCSFLQEVGYFEEYLWMYHEDVYLGLLAHYHGMRAVIVPKSEIYHKYEFASSIGRIDFMERNRFLLLLWFYRWPTLILILPALIVMEGGQWFFALSRGLVKKRWQGIKHFFSLKNWKAILKIRKRIQKLRKVSDREVLFKYATGVIDHQEINNPILTYVVNPVFSVYWWIIKVFLLWW